MNLFIMRHGDAQRALLGQADSDRAISALGEQELALSSAWLASETHGKVDWLLHSPYVRARQSAAQLSTSITATKQSESVDCTPDADPQFFFDWLCAMLNSEFSVVENVVVVAHMPFVSYLTAVIDKNASTPLFATAAIAKFKLDSNQHSGHLEQLYTPVLA